MPTVKQVLSTLKQSGKSTTRASWLRHGAPENVYGVPVSDLKKLAKQLRGEQELALALYDSGNFDAMYLAGLVADGTQMTKRQLEAWAKQAPAPMISEYVVPWVATENQHGPTLAGKWIRARRVAVATSGWCTYAHLAGSLPDEELDLEMLGQLLNEVVETIDKAPNRVRYTMNGFVIAVGGFVKPLFTQARRVAKQLGQVDVDMGDTACKVPLATAYLDKMKAAGRIGKKRKTVRC